MKPYLDVLSAVLLYVLFIEAVEKRTKKKKTQKKSKVM